MRDEGFYWVRKTKISAWQIAEFIQDKSGGFWFKTGSDNPRDPDYFCEVDEMKLLKSEVSNCL
jgi:hypothetical protein